MQMSYVEETETTLENTKSAKERGRKDRAGERRALILTHMKEQTTTTTWQPLPRSTHFTLSRGEVGKVLLSTWSTIEAFFFWYCSVPRECMWILYVAKPTRTVREPN